MPYKRIPIICGPTASGKSSLALSVCRDCGGELVSLDSMQIYTEMNIGTAKPSVEEMREIPHHLVDFLPPGEEYNVSLFKAAAIATIEDILSRGKLPVLCGGTGQYVQALTLGIQYAEMENSPEVRTRIEEEIRTDGAEAVHDRLILIDSESAARIHPNNTKRLVRALEIYEITGITMSEHNRRSLSEGPSYPFTVFLIDRPREELYDRINRRVDLMMQEGLLEEVLRLKQKGLAEFPTSGQAIGYKELFSYLDGQSSLEDAVECIKRRTRNYAKRQITWFSRIPEVEMVKPADFREILSKILL